MSEVNVNINIEGYATDQELTDGLATKVTKNANITGATKTKITYDEKGLVTAGADATTADIADSSNKRYVTDAQLTVIGNTSGTNTGDQDLSGYQLTSQKNQAGGYLGITAGNVVSLPNGMGFISLNVTPNQIAYFDNSGNLLTLSTVTYPSITELSRVKGVTSAIQTQLDAKSAITPVEQAITSSATVTPTFLNDIVIITAQATGLTLANPTGTVVPNKAIMIRIKDNGTARSITWDTQYRAIGVTLPTTTVLGKTLYIGMIYNVADTKWDVLGINQEA